jgi:DNA-binding beta-propeller fold protein YncE
LGFTKNFFVRAFEFVFGEEPQRIVRPMAVVDINKVLYVADPGAKGVHRFDRNASRYDLLRLENNFALPSPVGMALGEQGTVYVTDSALSGVFVIKPGAEFAVPLNLSEPVRQPTGVAFDPAARKLYVTSTMEHCIKVYSPDGKYLATLGRRGDQNGEFNFPTMLWHSGAGELLVTDSLNFRTQFFDASDQFAGKFGQAGDGGGDAPRQKGVATDRFGHVYAVDSLQNALQIFDRAGQFLLAVGGLGQKPGEFWLPTGIFIGADDLIYVADAYNQRVQVFRYVGGST